MNAASSALHRAFNAAAKAISTVGDLMDKTTLFSDPATKMHLTKAIDELVSNTHLALVTALNDKKNITGYITSDEVAKAGRLLENVANGRVPDDAVERVLIEAVHLHPYDTSFYELWLNLFGDQNGELDVIEEFFGVSVSTRTKADLFAAHKASLDLSTPEACERSLVDMEDYALSIGYRGFAAEKAEILMLAQQLDQERRTVAGVIYKSSQAATAAQDEIARTVKGVVHPTHVLADAEREKRTVGVGLGALICMVPFIGAPFTLRKGYSMQARVVSFGWAAAVAVFMQLAGQNHAAPATAAPAEKPAIATIAPVVPVPVTAPTAESPPATGQEAAIAHWTKLAEAGDADAQNTLAWSYAKGSGVPTDPAKALNWWQKSAIQGHPRAQFFLGQMMATGDGMVKDAVEGAKWLEKAAEQGESDAQFSLATLYKTGDGVPQDLAKADEWYQKAAAQGNSAALAVINGSSQ